MMGAQSYLIILPVLFWTLAAIAITHTAGTVGALVAVAERTVLPW